MRIEALKAKDIMKTDVIKVSGSTTLRELASLFEAERITGVPVVEGGEKLIGVISETDLVRCGAHFSPEEGVQSFPKDEEDEPDSSDSNFEFKSAHRSANEKTVEEIMTPWTISVYEDTPVVEIAKTMVKQRIHRVFVTDKESHLRGIITTMDIVEAVTRLDTSSANLNRQT